MLRKFRFFRYLRRKPRRHLITYDHLAFILILGKYFAVFPIANLEGCDHRTLKFKWISWIVSYTFVYLTALMVTMGFQIYNFFHVVPLKFGYFVTFLFYTCSFATTLLFVRLARNWPKLIQKWTQIDYRMISYGTDRKLCLHLKTTAIVVLLAAMSSFLEIKMLTLSKKFFMNISLILITLIYNLVEYTLYLATALTTTQDLKGWDHIETFFYNNFNFVFDYICFALWKAILLMIVNVMCTFTWNYMDLYIMLISIALTSKFKQIVTRLRTALANKSTNITFWKELRDDYNTVAELCQLVDDNISDIILLSFANNVFVILVQLFNSLRPRDGNIIGRIYFIYSFGFLLIRTAAVSLCAASINEASKQPTALLLSVSHEVYNIEIERLLYKIQGDFCALTGRKFFRVTKSLILNIAGAIVTYELVLIQFQVVT